jgi:hypothetical protein
MKQNCIELDQIATVMKLGSDDPRRRHLEECPRCASRMLLYERFLASEELPGADTASADAHLAAVMKAAIERGSTPDVEPERGGFLARVTRALFVSPAWAGAAVVVVLALAVVWWQPWETEEVVFRGDKSIPGVEQLLLEAPVTLEDGGVRLTWHSVEAADSYLIRFRTPDLDEIALLGPIADTSLVIDRSELPPGSPPVILWRVVALLNGDEIHRSRPASLELP